MCAKAGVPLPPSLMPIIAPAKKEDKDTQKSARDTLKELTEVRKNVKYKNSSLAGVLSN